MQNEEKPDFTVKMWLKIMNVLMSIMKELDQDFKVSNFFVNRQFFKLQKTLKVHIWIHINFLTNQNSPVVCLYQG